MAEQFAPMRILEALLDEHVDFVVVGGIAVVTYASDRATGDIDVMVPTDDPDNKRRLERALERLDATLIGTQAGHGRAPDPDDRYPTLIFSTRHGRLDVLYRPDGSAPYARVKERARTVDVLGSSVLVAGIDDLIRMKLAAGRRVDLDDVVTLTAGRTPATAVRRIRVLASWRLADGAGGDVAQAALAGRVAEADPGGAAWTDGRDLKLEAERSNLSEQHLRAWVRGLHHRLRGLELVTDPPDVTVDEL